MLPLITTRKAASTITASTVQKCMPSIQLPTHSR
jgi:hypothetical protein